MSDEMTPDLIAAAVAGYQHGSGVATFLRRPHQPDMSNTDIGLIGFACSGGNTIERMQYLGPRVAGNWLNGVSARRSCFTFEAQDN